ncbi:MAG: UbiA family prenyltransferase, partial [Longispora sp.]|nr:UbiA family prenyltransferase [Longispora sp. (in: high G+C Gram-positive bacteria)]
MLSLIRASHPEPTFAVTLVATVLAVGVGHSTHGVAAVAVAVLASQLSVGWGNDWLDAHRDVITGRTDKPIVTGAVSRTTVGWAAAIATMVTVPLGLLSGGWATIVLVVGLVSAWLYNEPLKRTPVSVLPYLVSFAMLPTFIVLGLPGHPLPPWWLPMAGALLGFGAHFANVLPDLEADLATGVRGLPHRVGATVSRCLAAAGLLGASVVLTLGPAGPPTWLGLFVVAIA